MYFNFKIKISIKIYDLILVKFKQNIVENELHITQFTLSIKNVAHEHFRISGTSNTANTAFLEEEP